jgi:hypothetical protein
MEMEVAAEGRKAREKQNRIRKRNQELSVSMNNSSAVEGHDRGT